MTRRAEISPSSAEIFKPKQGKARQGKIKFSGVTLGTASSWKKTNCQLLAGFTLDRLLRSGSLSISQQYFWCHIIPGKNGAIGAIEWIR